MKLLDSIKKANDVRSLNDEQLKQLASEIRAYLLETTSKTGGHLASNLGVVEITLAVHRYLNFPHDKLIFDVGHQSYVHKILTGRKEAMTTLRQLDGISGFTDRNESDCDSFIAGHASNAISAALGFATARELNKSDEKVVAIIGDGALTGGLSQEALNNASQLKGNLVIILNDNERSISANVGGVSNYLGKIRTSRSYVNLKRVVERGVGKVPVVGDYLVNGIYKAKESIKRLFVPGMLFEDLGLTYIGPIDGHDIDQLCFALENAFRFDEPVIIHALTKKGKGYKYAEEHPAQWHGVGAFDIETGQPVKGSSGPSYTDVFSEKIMELAEKDKDIVAITAAMCFGTGLYPFSKKYPDRYFDVGIAEEHAVCFAAALAAAGKKPVVAIYSTFLQRAFDQIIHDVCMQNLPVVFAVDRAGLVGNDGKTHQGIFDESFLSLIPNLVVMSPKNGEELQQMLEYAFTLKRPVAIRYARGEASRKLDEYHQPVVLNENEIMKKGRDVAILATGTMVETGLEVTELLKEKGYDPTLVNVRFLHDLDEKLLGELVREHRLIVTVEETVYTGSYGQRLASLMKKNEYEAGIINFTLPDKFIEHGSISQLRNRYHLDSNSITERIIEEL